MLDIEYDRELKTLYYHWGETDENFKDTRVVIRKKQPEEDTPTQETPSSSRQYLYHQMFDTKARIKVMRTYYAYVGPPGAQAYAGNPWANIESVVLQPPLPLTWIPPEDRSNEAAPNQVAAPPLDAPPRAVRRRLSSAHQHFCSIIAFQMIL